MVDRGHWRLRDIFLMGFSQGAIVAVDVALKTSARLGGVVAISSTALPEDMLQSVVGYEAPILGTHGK